MSTRETRANRRNPADQVRTLIREADDLVRPLDRATFNRRPAGGGWSVGECLEHLNATARLYLPVLTDAIEEARARGLTDGRRAGRTLLGRLVSWSQEPPVRFRMKTYDELVPESSDHDPADVMDEFRSLHEELIVRINESGDLDLKRVKVRSVLDARLKLSLGDWFAFLAAHGRRHLWQAGRVLAEIRQPAGAGSP